MIHRLGTAHILACAAGLACVGVVRAEEGHFASSSSSGLSLEQPVYAQTAAPRTPLMSALDRTGAAGQLDEYGLNVGGHVQVGWTYNFDTPDNQLNVGRVFDFEDQDPTFHQLDIFVERVIQASGDKLDIGG
jgi:hypothetical protein